MVERAAEAIPETDKSDCGDVVPIPTFPAKYAFPVVVAPPEMVSPPACVPFPMVEDAVANMPPVNPTSDDVALVPATVFGNA